MDTFVDERDLKLLETDKYTFFVMRRIMQGETQILLSDHEKLIICFTGQPFPVWIWTRNGASEEEFAVAFETAKAQGLLNGEYRFNIKYETAEYFIRRAAEEGLSLKISTNMFAYDCQEPVEPEAPFDGEPHCCTKEDIEDIVDMMDLFHQEIVIDSQNREEYRKAAEFFVQEKTLYLWKDGSGKNVATCKYAPNNNGMASINLVFTRPEARRRHYAENLVYYVSKLALDQGLVPMLYTDADYVASNACYEKIGYKLKGKLCTIGS